MSAHRFTPAAARAAQRTRTERFTKPRRLFRERLRTLPRHDGAEQAAHLLGDPPEWAVGFPVDRLIRSIRLVGDRGYQHAASYIAAHTKRPMPRLIGDLTDNQRAVLADWLRTRYGHHEAATPTPIPTGGHTDHA